MSAAGSTPPPPTDPRVAEAGRRARDRYERGANCAESLLASIPEAFDDDSLRLPVAAGRGFTGGIGESGCVCGALAAATMVAGAETERRGVATGASRGAAVDLAAEVQARFAEQFGGTCCRVLRRGMDHASPECRENCARITEDTTVMLAEMIAASRTAPSRADRRSLRDIATQAIGVLRLLIAASAGATGAWAVLGGGLPALAGFAAS
ncbi:MAG: C-GCAxxG-C-C family protein, partial [Actinomycetota bacterium]|nr:C-GCAxxG-C-C family protein [Actinomycetota bacterium]